MVSGQWGQDVDCHPTRDTKQEGVWIMPEECDPTQQSLSRHAKKQRACAHDKSTSSCSQQTSDHPEGPNTQHGIGR